MAKAIAKPCIKKKSGKKSYLVIVAPPGVAFKPTTKAKTVQDGTTTWDIDKQDASSDSKKITIKISGKARVSATGAQGPPLSPDPDSGILVITLDDPPVGVDPDVILPVEYVDDFD